MIPSVIKIATQRLFALSSVGKSGAEGQQLKEAKYINLSLHYLEAVIISLQQVTGQARKHIPYRNSLLTKILRDSLGVV